MQAPTGTPPAHGIVFGEAGPLVGARVTLTTKSGEGAYSTDTNSAGGYELRTVPPGRYELSIRPPNLDPHQMGEIEVSGTEGTRRIHVLNVDRLKAEADTERANPTPKPNMIGPGKVKSARLIHQVRPVYPEAMKSKRISGEVTLSAAIGRDGTIHSLTSVSSPHDLLTAAAMAAVRQWRYKATTLNDVPVEVITVISVNFALGW